MTSDTCWTSIPRLRRSVEIRTRLEPVRKLRKISSRSFWDNPACWRNTIKTIFQSIFCQNFSLEFKCWSRCGKKKIRKKDIFHAKSPVFESVISVSWSYHGRHCKISSVHLPLQPFYFAAHIAEDDGLLHSDGVINIAQRVQLPVLWNSNQALSK